MEELKIVAQKTTLERTQMRYKTTLIIFAAAALFILLSSPGAGGPEQDDYKRITREKMFSLFKIRESTVNAVTPGGTFRIPLYMQTKFKDKYLSLTDEETVKALKTLGAEITLDPEKNRAKIETSLGVREIDGAELKSGGKTTRMSPPPFFTKGHYFIHLKHIPDIANCLITKKGDDTLFFDGLFRTAVSSKDKKKVTLTIECSCPFKAETLMLRNPNRYVVDLQNISLSKAQNALPKREIKDANLGTITYGQNRNFPGAVRVVIPTGDDVDVQPVKAQKKRECAFSMFKKASDAPEFNFTAQKVTGITTKGDSKKLEVDIAVSGSVTYESHRYSSPDNRVVIDIHKSQLAGKKTSIKPKSGLVEEIKAAQFQLEPTPVTRVVINLKKNYICAVSSSKDRIYAIITDKPSSSSNAEMDRTGATSYPTGKKVICIDPGHGGYDPGAINGSTGAREKDITLKIALKLSETLAKRGWNVVMTRKTDRDVSYYGSTDSEELGARVAFGKNMRADIFVSIHCNASTSTSSKGISTHWSKWADKRLGECIHKHLVKNIGTTDRKTSRNDFYVISKSTMPAVLLETGFITNSHDLQYLNSNWGQKKVAESIADGIEEYFRTTKK